MKLTLDTGIILLALDVYAVYRAISRSHGVNSTLAWIFAILAFPGMGAIAYLLVANPGIKNTTRRKRLGNETIRRSISENVRDTHLKQQGSILHLSSVLTGLRPTGGNTVELLTENEYAFEKIEQEVLAAKRFIWVEYYIISNDENEDDAEPTVPFYSQNQPLRTDEKSVSQRLYAAEIKPQIDGMEKSIRFLVQKLPGHREYLNRYCPAAPTTAQAS